MTNSTYTQRWNDATPRVTGNDLARRRLSKAQRARIAAGIMDGVVKLEALNQGQISAVCKVSLAYARRMRRPQSVSQLQAAE
jgi:hypothetical protein